MSIGQEAGTGAQPRTNGRVSADSINRATENLADILRRIESGELPMSASTVRRLEEATRVLEDVVEKSG